jgi:hypothetical protein
MQMPGELVADMEKSTRSLVLTPDLEQALPRLKIAFWEANEAYQLRRFEYLYGLERSLFSVKSPTGEDINCSLIYDEDSAVDELLVSIAAFADEAPARNSIAINEYTAFSNPSFWDKQKAQPNSWNQITKSAINFEILKALESNMPVLTIFRPIRGSAYEKPDRLSLRKGDFSPTSQIVQSALAETQIRLHGYYNETEITDMVHMHGASLGGSEAIGSAAELNRQGIFIPSVTVQELILGPKNLGTLANRFLFKSMVGAPSDADTDGMPRIPEPAIRREIDGHGNELNMLPRMIRAMGRLTLLSGLVHQEKLLADMEHLLAHGTPITVGLAENSHLTSETTSLLPEYCPTLFTVKLRGVEGQKLGHIANEHASLSATVLALGVSKSAEVEPD